MDCNSKGITDFRKRLYWEEFKTLVTLLPPAEEQAAISTVVAEKLAVIDGGVALKHKQIAALKEYKATLINSAVTGKIKVA
jgi:type I restriction enzyme S subunit